MRNLNIVIVKGVSIALAAAGSLMACDSPAPAPSLVRPFFTHLEVIAPPRLAPGATTQLRLIRRFSDGTSEDITDIATFSANSSDVLDVSRKGFVTALKLGEDFVGGQTETEASDGHEIVVVPDGTFRVVGRVVEADTSGVPVGGVRVEADGVTPVFTSFDGLYRLYGVPGHAGMRVSKSGYTTRELALTISDHHTENVALTLAGSRLDFAGTYQLTIEASPDCLGRIPEKLLTRRFAVGIAQIGQELRVELTGANIIPGGRDPRTIIPGRVERSGVVLELASPSHCEFTEPDSRIIEVVDGTILEISGLARLSSAGPGLTGTLHGNFIIRGSSQCSAEATAWCPSPSHRIALTR